MAADIQASYGDQQLMVVSPDVGGVVRARALADGLDPDMMANPEPRLRNLECDTPHKLGGQIDTVYADPLKKGRILLLQLASDAATGWICGDLRLIYVSIDAAEMEAGNFDRIRAWLEA
jgi:phosphoribosylpyrophosphate synthetase